MPTDDNFYDKKIAFWNKVYRIALFCLVLAATLFAGFGVYRIYHISADIQSSQQAFQDSTIQARKDNIRRQQDNEDYIKCLVLVKFDVPPEQLTTRDGVAKALDDCANR